MTGKPCMKCTVQITHIVDRVGEEIPLWDTHLWTHPLPEDDQRALVMQ